jgi:WD40 repeat protein
MDDLLGHESAICVVSVSNDSKMLASGDYYGIVRLWDLIDGALLHNLEGPDGEITGSVFSQGAELLATSHFDNTIHIWNTQSGSCAMVLTSTDGIGSIAFSPDSSLLASTTRNDMVRLWRIEDGKCLQGREFPRVGTCDIEFDPSGSQLIFDAGQLSIEGLGAEDQPIDLVDTGFALSKDSRWVTWRGNKILWLPSSVHPSNWLIRGSTVAIGCTSGKVIVMRFGDI